MMKNLLSNFFRLRSIEDSEKKTLLSSLAPKVLKDVSAIEKIQPYLDKLNEAIDTEGICNIALTGGYGSGKSTVIKTFQYLNPNYKYLNISLASFNKKKEDKTATVKEKKVQKEELERLLEVSILQQIFYHVKPKQIPDSRFKRIDNISSWRILGMSLGFILWIISIVLLLKYNYLDNIDPKYWKYDKDFDWWTLPIFLVSFSGLGLVSKLFINLFSNSKINKVTIKGELELGDNINKSVFNEHLEEILYFFERTNYNVVIIEDLDRFDSTDIFTKLREINILLNNSLLIEREINFVYAVGDDLFDDRKERVKFFEYIIPVIPFINSSNADEQLSLLIKESSLDENILTKEFISDVTTFIDDIDMRLLINIFQEFVIYRKTLKPEYIKKNDELFAMITYKNLDPNDFTKLNRKEGKLYELINNKKNYIDNFIEKIDSDIEDKYSEIRDIENQNMTDAEELKSIYILNILSNLPQNALIDKENIENNLDKLIEDESVNYRSFRASYGDLIGGVFTFKFSEIEKEVNPFFTFEERKELIESKYNNKINLLKNQIDELKRKKVKIKNWDLKQIFIEVDVNQYLDDFSNNSLLRNLILNGYINENYNDYISLFHEVSITKEDFTFERNVKSGYASDFSYKLSNKIENLIDKIDIRYFEREVILNFDLIDYLGANYDRYSDKYDSIIKLISNEKSRSIEFIDAYIEDEDRPLEIFIEKITENWKRFWDYIYVNSNYSEEKKNKYLAKMVRFSKVETILNNQNHISLSESIEMNPNFLSLLKDKKEFNHYGKITELLAGLDVKFEKLEDRNDETKKIFDYIYENNHYKRNKENLLQMLLIYGKEIIEDDFYRFNYSTILNSECAPLIDYINTNIEIYIEKVYLKLENNKFEIEENLVELLNKHFDNKLKIKVIQKTETKIFDLKKINDVEIKTQLLLNNKVDPSWHNVIDYYTVSENLINEHLIEFLEFDDTSTQLSEKKLLKEDEAFEAKILVCNEISDNTYNKLIKSVYFSYNKLAFESLNERKVIELANTTLNTTKSNYDLLRNYFKDNHIRLLERNFMKFIDEMNDYETDEEDVISLLKSKRISLNNKTSYIVKLDEQHIIESKRVCELIGEVILQKDSKVSLDSNTLVLIVKSIPSIEKSVKLTNLYLDSLDDSALIELVKCIGYEYRKLFIKQNKPTFNKTKYNETLLNTLKVKGLINSFDVDRKDQNQYRAVANY